MRNSFNFKNPSKITVIDSNSPEEKYVRVNYKYWHWEYYMDSSRLKVEFLHSPAVWLTKLPESFFILNVQIPVYWFNSNKSFPRKPIYDRNYVNWETETSNVINIKVNKDGSHLYFTFEEKIKNYAGDEIITIYKSMKGFCTEFKELLKSAKTCSPEELDTLLKGIDCRLTYYSKDFFTTIKVNTPVTTSRYPEMIYNYEIDNNNIPADVPF
jgi:hypothetical protein